MKPVVRTPSKVRNPSEEKDACLLLVAVETELREIEEMRKKVTQPQRKALDEINAQAKAASSPYEAAKSKLVTALEAYRQSPEVQEKVAEQRRLKRENRKAALEGDAELAVMTARKYEESDVKVSVDCGDHQVRFIEKPEVEEIDYESLPDRYFMRVPNMALIEEDIKNLGSVKGVTHRWKCTPTVYRKPSMPDSERKSGDGLNMI